MPVTIAGLPVHILLVHAAVVMVPLLALITVAVAAVPRWRSKLIWVVGADVVLLGGVGLTGHSGEQFLAKLQSRGAQLPQAVSHGHIGSSLKFFVAGLVVSAVIAWYLRTKAPWVGIVLTSVAAVAVIGWTVYTGDSGARAVWEATMKSL